MCCGVDFSSSALVEIVAIPLAPLVVTLGKGGKAHIPYTVHMPKSRGKVHPFLTAVLADRAAKPRVDAEISLLQKSDAVVLHHRLGLGVQTLLPVQRFQLSTNCVHRRMLVQFRPVVSP